jgi:hypothetical protein
MPFEPRTYCLSSGSIAGLAKSRDDDGRKMSAEATIFSMISLILE